MFRFTLMPIFLCRSIGVSNFGVQHLEGLRKAGRPTPSVNQIELHPQMRKQDIVDYCRKHGIVVMGYSPLAKAQRMNDKKLIAVSNKYNNFTTLAYKLQSNLDISKFKELPAKLQNNRVSIQLLITKTDLDANALRCPSVKVCHTGGNKNFVLCSCTSF